MAISVIWRYGIGLVDVLTLTHVGVAAVPLRVRCTPPSSPPAQTTAWFEGACARALIVAVVRRTGEIGAQVDPCEVER